MRTSIIIQNLKCGGCEKTIVSKISKLNNISAVTVNGDTSVVSFIAQNPEDALTVKDTLKRIGYPSIEDENTVISKAKSFVSCASGKMAK